MKYALIAANSNSGNCAELTLAQRNIINSCRAAYNASNYTLVHNGYHNVVAILEEKLKLQIPRSHNAAMDLYRDSLILRQLAGKKNRQPVAVPRLIEYSREPTYMITSYIPGQTASFADILLFSTSQRQAFGKHIAKFIHWFGESVSVDTYKSIPELAAGSSEGMNDAHATASKLCVQLPSHRYPVLKRHTSDLTARLKSYYSTTGSQHGRRVVHDDLFLGNIILNDSGGVAGVIDFAEAGLGDVARELRQLYNLDPVIAHAAIKEFGELSGEAITYEPIRFWAEFQTAVILCDRIHNRLVGHSSYKRARENIIKQFPDMDWSELF